MTLPHRAPPVIASRLWSSALLTCALVLLLHLSWIAIARGNPDLLGAGSSVLNMVESGAAAVAVTVVAARKLRRRERGRYGWSFLALALLANSAGDLAWWQIQRNVGEVPVPSIADPIYLAFYPLFAIGLVLMPAVRPTPGERLRLGIDMGSALLAGTLLFWVFGVGPLLEQGQIPNLKLAVTLAYPAGDIALLWALLFLMTRRAMSRDRRTLRLLAAGTGIMLVADWFYSYQVLRGVYTSGDFVDFGYAAMAMLFALAALSEWRSGSYQDDGTPVRARAEEIPVGMVGWSLLMPYAAMLLALALIVWDYFRPTGVPFPVLVLFFGGIIGLLSARQLLAARENDTLRRSERALNAELLAARNELEARIEARTRELLKANAALEVEIAEHERAEAELRASLAEKGVLLKEVHHRVKNNLQIVHSLFSLQGQKTKDAALIDALLDGQTRIKAMALIHEKLYASPDLARLDFGDYLRVLVAHLYRIYRPYAAPVALELDAPTIWMNVDTAVACGLIVNELVANALKHAFPDGRSGTVAVCLAAVEAGKLRLSVEDNGIGLPVGFDLRQTDSLGLQLAVMLVRQLDGAIELQRGQGTRFEITFPAPVS